MARCEVLVTGAGGGIGRAVAASLHTRGITRADCNLSLMREIRRFAATLDEPVDVLVNNAGLTRFEREVTDEGLEMTFAVNHIAPFLLTNLLLQAGVLAAGARVVTVTSDRHKQVTALSREDDAYVPLRVYEETKLMNIWFTRALAARHPEITATCVAPGFVRTGLARDARGTFGLFLKLVRPFQKTPEAPARHIVRLATGDFPSGAYFQGDTMLDPSPFAQDQAQADALWARSAEICSL